ncbi:hypothetical protein [Hyalangium sp.]|nr:hypothetical protein [Hyalangium sp.]HYH97008.1 hypothetical protein [Hyalangium sp.]
MVLLVAHGEPDVRQREAERVGADGYAVYPLGVEWLAKQSAQFVKTP